MSCQIERLNFSHPFAFMFDLDGTILDSTPWHMKAFRDTLNIFAPHKVTELNEFLVKGRGTIEILSALGFTDKDDILELAKYKRKLYQSFVQNKKVRLFTGVTNLLNFIKSKDRLLVLVTSTSSHLATLCLETNNLNGMFDYMVTGEQVTYGKPAPDIFQYALKCVQLQPWQTVTIEDSEIGAQASIASSIPVVLVNRLEAYSNIPIFHTFTELFYQICLDFKEASLDHFSQTKPP